LFFVSLCVESITWVLLPSKSVAIPYTCGLSVVLSQGSRVKVMLIGTQTWAWGYFSGQIWELEDTLATRVSSSPFFAPSSLLGWIRNDLVQKSCFSASDCFPLSSKDDLSQPATEVSLRSTSWISLQNPTFSLIAEICTMSEKGRCRGKGRGGANRGGPWQQQPPQ
jgi:hypothetical protein